MANTRNSPTGGELAAEAPSGGTLAPGAEGGDTPLVSSDDTDADRTQQDRQPAGSDEDVSDDYAKQNPPPGGEELQEDEQALLEASEEAEAEKGQVWARYRHDLADYHSRGLTVQDQIDLGVPEDKVVDNSEKASYGGVRQPSGLWFTRANRHRVNVSDVHPALLQYLEEDDPNFEITRY